MSDEDAVDSRSPIDGQKKIIDAINADRATVQSRELHRLERYAYRALFGLRHGKNSFDDVVLSAIRTALRRQDPGMLKNGEAPDPLPEDETEVWKLIRSHLRRKISTARAQPRQKCNRPIREADLANTESREAWLASFLTTASVDERNDADAVELYIHIALNHLEEALVDADASPQMMHVARLAIMGCTSAETAEALGITLYRVRQERGRIEDALRGR